MQAIINIKKKNAMLYTLAHTHYTSYSQDMRYSIIQTAKFSAESHNPIVCQQQQSNLHVKNLVPQHHNIDRTNPTTTVCYKSLTIEEMKQQMEMLHKELIKVNKQRDLTGLEELVSIM